MPLPFIIAGLAGIIGAGGHMAAKETNEKAQRISQSAQELYNEAKRSLEQEQNKTEKSLLKLGYAKKNVLDSSMRQFLKSYDKIKQVQVNQAVNLDELSKFTFDQQGAIEIRQMTDIYADSIKSGATGAAAGAVVALAASGSLSIVTGSLATAGSALLAGEVTAAAGIAGSALSFGAAMTPLAAVAAPVVLFTGISASMKADENLEKANAMYAEAEAASEKMKVSETLCIGITKKADMFDELLENLNKMFSECSGLLAGVLKKKEGKVFKKKLNSQDFSEEEIKLIAVTRALAGAVKSVIDTPILSQDGNISEESTDIYDHTVEKLPDFHTAVDEVQYIDYQVKPIQAKVPKTTMTHAKSAASGPTILSNTRNIIAIILGVVLGTMFCDKLALRLTSDNAKVLIWSSYFVNKCAIWLVICSAVTMLIGKYRKTVVEKCCGYASGIALSALYVQYCRTFDQMEHYIIASVVVFVICSYLYSALDEKKQDWQSGAFFSCIFLCMAMMPILFLLYAFASKFFGFASGMCMNITTVLMVLFALGGMVGTLDEA